jgi:predicted transcriptional regulator
MQWGLALTHRWTVGWSIPASTHPVTMFMEPTLLQQVQDAAAHGASRAVWMRQAMRHVTPEHFPTGWRAGETVVRSHHSQYYCRSFMRHLDDETLRKLETLTQAFHRSAAEVIRQLIAQATPEAFPPSWQTALDERRQPEARRADHIKP